MARTHRSFRLERPKCPQCASQGTRVAPGIGNLLRIVADGLLALFLAPIFSYRLRCEKCGFEFPVGLEER